MLLAMKARNVIGTFRSVFLSQFDSCLLLVKLSVVKSFFRCQGCLTQSISRLYSAGNC